jgi:hypothetical protein
MTTRQQSAVAFAGAIRKLIEVLIGRDQGMIGAHERATEAQAALIDAVMNALATRVEERATND